MASNKISTDATVCISLIRNGPMLNINLIFSGPKRVLLFRFFDTFKEKGQKRWILKFSSFLITGKLGGNCAIFIEFSTTILFAALELSTMERGKLRC